MFTQLFWIIVDLVADFLAGVVMRGGGYGVVGALIDGFIMNASGGNILYSILIAFIGACILIAILLAVAGGHRTIIM